MQQIERGCWYTEQNPSAEINVFRKSQQQIALEFTRAIQQDYTQLFYEVARALTSTLELEDVLTLIMNRVAQFFGPERWSMMLVDKEQNDLYYVIAVGEDSNSLKGLRVPMGEGVAGYVAATGVTLVVPDTKAEPLWQDFMRRYPDLNIQSIACVPVRSADGVIGVIQLLNSKIDLLSEYSVQFLRVLGDFSAIAVRNAEDMKRIHLLSITDDCTGLYNARYLYELLAEQLALPDAPPFSLLFIDLDRFKNVNDTHGHLVGSRLLMEVGEMIRKVAGTTNPAFRYGGDEFVVLLPNHAKESGRELATKLFHTLRESRFLIGEGLSLELRGSFGMATFPEDGTTVESIIKSADAMMYHVKGTSRDNLAIAGFGSIFVPGTIEGDPENGIQTAADEPSTDKITGKVPLTPASGQEHSQEEPMAASGEEPESGYGAPPGESHPGLDLL